MKKGDVVIACSSKDVAPFSAQGFVVCDKSEYKEPSEVKEVAPVKVALEKKPKKKSGKADK